jgi:hypothetical protein
MYKIKISFIIFLIFNLLNCNQGSGAGDKTAQNAYALTLLETSSGAKQKCNLSVEIMNQCIGDGFQNQFNPANMCANANLKPEADYSTLVSCVSQKVNSTYCNFPQNRVGDARIAYTNFFKSCNLAADGKTETGIIIQDWYTLTLPTF